MSEVTGLTLYDKKSDRFVRYHENRESNSITSNHVNSVYEDPVTKIFWIVNTHNGVVDKIDPRTLHFEKWTPKGPVNRRILRETTLRIIEAHDGKLWVSTGGAGISIIDRENDKTIGYPFTQFDTTHTVKQMLLGMAEDRNGNFWAMEYGGALLQMRLDGESMKLLKLYAPDPQNPNSPLVNDFYGRCLFIDRDDPNTLWYSTSKGVTRFHIPSETFTHFIHDPQNDNSLIEGTVWGAHEDTLGNIWVSVYGGNGGFCILNKKSGEIKRYEPDLDNPSGMHVQQNGGVYFDSFGNTWIYGYKNGMDKFDRKTNTFKHFNKTTGLPIVGISNELVEDDEGNLWIGSANSGIVKFDIATEKVEATYTESDGILSNTIWAVARTKDGTLWFSGDKGITSFHPDDIKANDYIPPVALTRLTQAGITMDLPSSPERTKELYLDWQSNFFEFQFAGLNYTKPEKNQFAYMLEGVDNDWYHAGSNPFGRYSGLAGGNYTLHLKASNNDGIWNEEGVSIQVHVSSPFWKTWWFYLILLLFVVGIVILLFRYQLRINGERIKLKAMESAKEAAESANKAKSDFLANMSHEIRTPLNAIIGFSEILKNRVDEKSSESINSINLSGKSLLNLVNDILDLSKIEAGKMELQYVPVSIHTLFDEMNTIFKEKMAMKELDFIRHIESDVPKALLMDETRLRQVLINLIGNAIKFTEEGMIELKASFNGGTLTIQVKDTGIGIPKDQQEYIFGTFNQMKDQDQRKYHGTGLGLSISKRFVEMLQGDIQVDSMQGRGTTFTITLRNVEVIDESLLRDEKVSINCDTILFEKCRILVADDYKYNREVIKGYLENSAIEIYEAENGAQALEIIRDQKPDLVLLDIKMPEMDGYEVIERVQADPALQTIPLVAVTASAMKSEEDKLKEICSGYLRKPLMKEHLFVELMKHLEYTRKESSGKPVDINQGGDDRELLLESVNYLREQKEKIEDLLQQMSIDTIGQFADTLRDKAAENCDAVLELQAKRLHDACDLFNIPLIKEILETLAGK